MKNKILQIVLVILICITILIIANHYKKYQNNENFVVDVVPPEDEAIAEDKLKLSVKKINTLNSKIANLFNNLKLPEFQTSFNNKMLDSQDKVNTVNKINLVIQHNIDKINEILGGGNLVPITKLGIPEPTIQSVQFMTSSLLTDLGNKYMMPPKENSTDSNNSTQSNTSTSNFADVTKTKEKFKNIFDSQPSMIPLKVYEKFENDWRSNWLDKINSSSKQIVPYLNPEIADNYTKFNIIVNPDLEKNLENHTADILNFEIDHMNDSLKNKWIQENKKFI